MSTEAKATGYLELDLTGFDQAIKTAKKMLGGLAAGFAAFKTAEFFKEGIKDAITFGKEMQVASNKMGGFDVGKMLIVQKALEKAGLGAEEARGAMADFVDSGRDISTIFGGADNYAKALKSAAADYGSQAGVLRRSAEKLQAVWNTLESIGTKLRTFFLSMTARFVKPLQAALNYLNQMDLEGIGSKFGDSIAKAATTLLGLFKNGDIWKAAKIGLSIAFQEAVNVIVGGINMIPSLMGKAFVNAMGTLKKGWDLLFSSDAMSLIGYGFLGVANKFTSAMFDGINKVVKFLGAGFKFALESAQASPEMNTFAAHVNAIGEGITSTYKDDFDYAESYNRYRNEGTDINPDRQSFEEILDSSSGIIPQEFIDSMRKNGNELLPNLGEKFDKFAEKILSGDGGGKFKKGNVFENTESLKKQLDEILGNAYKTGKDMIDKSTNGNKPPKILNQLSGGGAHIIADSLAKVGGGGNSLKVGMSLAERSALRTARATEQTAKATEAMAEQGKGGGGTTKPPLGR